MSLPAGSRLGPYEILAPLGAGGMGEVHRARDPRLGREVAIKVLPAERLGDVSRRRRFVQEARAASSLNHPSIVTIHEIEQDGGTDFIVMELVSGKSLDKVIPKGGLSVAEALRLAVPIADALARAHAAGIVHRDLKPANVMVNDSGPPKILDFGLAKLVQTDDVAEEHTATEETASSPLSQPGAISGTPAYMSPEQATGKTVDARSDVFSFGSMLYEVVTPAGPGATNLWIIRVESGSDRRLTSGSVRLGPALWSRDGRFIYSQPRTGGTDIYRMKAAGGEPERSTERGAVMAELSWDGRQLLYGGEGWGPLFLMDVEARRDVQIEECGRARTLGSSASALYWVGCSDTAEKPLYRFDTATGKRQRLGSVTNVNLGLAVSPDGKTILYARENLGGADLMMIENFR
jgi:serine/threonine protein kinase